MYNEEIELPTTISSLKIIPDTTAKHGITMPRLRVPLWALPLELAGGIQAGELDCQV
jgi:hypothetical protein